MSRLRCMILGLALVGLPAAAGAEPLLDRYVARLGPEDHFNSDGVRLRSAAAIIRQDRANLYGFGGGDPEDEADDVFDSKANRARLEAMLNAGRSPRRVLARIVNGNPLVEVSVYRRRIVVEILR